MVKTEIAQSLNEDQVPPEQQKNGRKTSEWFTAQKPSSNSSPNNYLLYSVASCAFCLRWTKSN